VIVDSAIQKLDTSQHQGIFSGSGLAGRLLRFPNMQALLKLSGAQVLPVATRPKTKTTISNGGPNVLLGCAPGAGSTHLDVASSSGVASAIEADLKFFADNMLRPLGKMLRVAGIDCVYHDDIIEKRTGEALSGDTKTDRYRARMEEIEQMLRFAKEQDRVVLTSDGKVLRRLPDVGPRVQVLVLDNRAKWEDLYSFVCSRFPQICISEDDILSRCVVCNSKGFHEFPAAHIVELIAQGSIPKKDVPPKVLEETDTFYRCKNHLCAKVYWQGNKFLNLIKMGAVLVHTTTK